MKRFLIGTVLVASCFVGSAAFAQDGEGDEVETRFYDFNDMLIDGEFLRPDGMFATERGRARFDSLLSLERSFRDEISEAAQEESLQK